MQTVTTLGLLGASALLLLVCAPVAEGTTTYHMTHHSSPCHSGITVAGYNRAVCLGQAPIFAQASDVYACTASGFSPRCKATAAPDQYCANQGHGRCPDGTQEECPTGDSKGLDGIVGSDGLHLMETTCKSATASDISGRVGDNIVLVWEKTFWPQIARDLGAKGTHPASSEHNEVWTWSDEYPQINSTTVFCPDNLEIPLTETEYHEGDNNNTSTKYHGSNNTTHKTAPDKSRSLNHGPASNSTIHSY